MFHHHIGGDLGGGEEIKESLDEAVDLVTTQLALAVHTVNEADRHLADTEAKLTGSDLVQRCRCAAQLFREEIRAL